MDSEFSPWAFRHTARGAGKPMLTFPNDTDTAVIVLHEIYGVNRHILDACARYQAEGYSVFCPEMLGAGVVFPYERRDDAYAYFMNTVGFGSASVIERLVADMRRLHRRLYLIGYSVGATLAWLAAGGAACDGIVCHYGSRIRDYPAAMPSCPALLVLAEDDAAFPPARARDLFGEAPNIVLGVFAGDHGFCDEYGSAYRPASAEKARMLVQDFLHGGKT